MTGYALLYTLGFAMIIVGSIILTATAIFVATNRGKKGKAKAAGVIIIGPVPIVFGSDNKTVKTILTLSVTLTVSLILLLLVYHFLFR